MVYLFAALYCEAEGLIERYQLSRNSEISRYQVFENEKFRLTLTGSGSVPAAVAVTYICTRFQVTEEDFLVNFGICAGPNDCMGKMFACHKIVEQATGRDYYPDMLYAQEFPEKTIVTVPRVVSEPYGGNLADMEAGAVYQAAVQFVPVHRMAFLKIVSDSGAEKVDAKKVRELLKDCEPALCAFLERRFADGPALQGAQDMESLEKLVCDMKCSVVMEQSLRQLLRYCSLAGIDWSEQTRRFHEDKRLPCKSKREGKICFEELRRQLL